MLKQAFPKLESGKLLDKKAVKKEALNVEFSNIVLNIDWT